MFGCILDCICCFLCFYIVFVGLGLGFLFGVYIFASWVCVGVRGVVWAVMLS